MSKPRRMHPATILFNFLKSLRQWIFYIIVSFFALKDDALFYYVFTLAVLITIILTFSFLSWYRFTYQIKNEELQIEYGVLVRKKRYISKHRIQSIDLTAGVIHRILRLVKVQIETASGGNEAEAMLKAVTQAEGDSIRSELKRNTTKKTKEVEDDFEENEEDRIVYDITFKRLLLAGATSGSVGVILAFLGVAFSELVQYIPDEFYDSLVTWAIGLSILLIIGLLLIVIFIFWLMGVMGTVIKYWGFKVIRVEDELYITRGLLEKKQITIPLKRIQAIGITESIIRQPFGYVTVFAEVAGSSLEKGEDFSTVLFPIMKKEEVTNFLESLLPDYKISMQNMNALPKRALKYYLVRASIFFLLLSVGILYFIAEISWILIPILVITLFLGYFRHKDAAYLLNKDKNRLIIRYRKLNKTTVVLFHKRVQALEIKQHKAHEKENLATVKLSIIGGQGVGKHYKLKELEEKDVHTLFEWYSN